jgi:hypothetical protein
MMVSGALAVIRVSGPVALRETPTSSLCVEPCLLPQCLKWVYEQQQYYYFLSSWKFNTCP